MSQQRQDGCVQRICVAAAGIVAVIEGISSETENDWLVHRRLDLHHRSMDHVIADLNELC